jgi:hypothetical protein
MCMVWLDYTRHPASCRAFSLHVRHKWVVRSHARVAAWEVVLMPPPNHEPAKRASLLLHVVVGTFLVEEIGAMALLIVQCRLQTAPARA